MNEADKELLEFAAKAYDDPGIIVSGGGFSRRIGYNDEMGCDVCCAWNPLLDDGDALRLAIRLQIAVYRSRRGITSEYQGVYFDESPYPDPYAATRRAIVRAAAEIGRNK